MLNFGIYRTNTEEIVEHLREKMIRLAEERGNLTHPDVIAISQQLDLFCVQIQRNRLDNLDNISESVKLSKPNELDHLANASQDANTCRPPFKPTHKDKFLLHRFTTSPVLQNEVPQHITKIYS